MNTNRSVGPPPGRAWGSEGGGAHEPRPAHRRGGNLGRRDVEGCEEGGEEAAQGDREGEGEVTTMCAGTDKYRHASYVDAQEALGRIRRRGRKGKREARVYRCDYCSGYHLTSEKRSRGRAKAGGESWKN